MAMRSPHHHGRPSLRRWVATAVALGVLTTLTVLTGPVAAQEGEPSTQPPGSDPAAGAGPADQAGDTQPAEPEAPAPPPVDPSPQLRVVLAKLSIMHAEDVLASEEGKLVDVRAELEAANQHRDAARAVVADAQRRLERARRLLADLAVSSFMYASGGTSSPAARITVYEKKKERELTRAVMDNKVAVVRQHEEALDDAQHLLDDRQAEVDALATRVADQEAMVALARQALDDARRELRTAQAQDAPVLFDPADTGRWQLPIAGESVLSAEELTAWFEHVGGQSRAGAPVADLARWYIEEGAAEGLRGDVAFAQAVLETGGFTNDDTVRFNNYAGIGHCDSCPTGWAFPSPQEGVRAQIQLLKSYVYDKPEYRFELVDRRLRGPAGCCQTWNQLTGVWASASHYGPAMLGIYLNMAEFALDRRTMMRAMGAG
ncbi:glucosaminidase domain-containing protein [Rhabdothermincola sp.]|uniref:glucosaminidase domain-containing protein n=1 Tax=Rhabdothermincola sp. TaxID=2820405 RepID=UPI002FE36EE6